MRKLAVRVLGGTLGLAAVLGYWALRSGGEGHPEVATRIPARVWEGGGGVLALRVETSCAARMSISFSENGKKGGRSLEARESIGPGVRSWTIDVPRGAGGTIELGAERPKEGDTLRFTVALDGRTVDEQSETLDEELRPGYAFFLQSEHDDYSRAKPEPE